jgi:hypothetical protein
VVVVLRMFGRARRLRNAGSWLFFPHWNARAWPPTYDVLLHAKFVEADIALDHAVTNLADRLRLCG